jgi:hypothetical protein
MAQDNLMHLIRNGELLEEPMGSQTVRGTKFMWRLGAGLFGELNSQGITLLGKPAHWGAHREPNSQGNIWGADYEEQCH